MEVEENEENSFLDDSEDTDNEEPVKEVKVEKKESPTSARYDGKSNTIRISPIPRGFTESHIYDFIMSVIDNEPLSIMITMPKQHIAKSKQHALYDAQNAYIVLQSPNDASLCANKLNKTQFAGFQCQVSLTNPSKNNCMNYKNKTNWIKITNLKKTVNEQAILTHIQKHGEIQHKPKNIYLFHHETKDNYPGYAFIECANSKDATTCVSNLKMSQLNGNKIWCTWRPQRRDLDRKETEFDGKTRQLILGNLHYTLKQNDITKLCAEFGQIEHVQMWYDKSGYPTGSASITMQNVEDAQKVFNGLHGKKVNNLSVMTAYTKIQNKKKQVINKLNTQNRNLKKSLMKNKKVIKKMEIDSKGGRPLRNNARRAGKGKGGKRVAKGRRDGVGFGKKKGTNTSRAFAKKMRGRGKGRGRGRGKGPKFA